MAAAAAVGSLVAAALGHCRFQSWGSVAAPANLARAFACDTTQECARGGRLAAEPLSSAVSNSELGNIRDRFMCRVSVEIGVK